MKPQLQILPLSLLLITLSASSCASLTGKEPMAERYVACPQESVWEGALDALQHYPITTKDKNSGVIETSWRIQPVQGQPYGLFGREGLGNKERSQLTFRMKPLESGVTLVQLTERRQHWGFRGGGQIYQWYPVEPSQQTLDGVMNQLTVQLDKEGCFIEL